MNHAILRHCVFVDECGYNKWTVGNHGKVRQGARANRQVCSQRGRNVKQAISSLNAVIQGDVSRPEIRARMDDRGGLSGGQTPRYSVRRKANLIATRCSSALIGVVTAAKAYQWFRFKQTYLPRCFNEEEIEG